MQIKRSFWWPAFLIFAAVAVLLIYHPEAGSAAASPMTERGYGVQGYLRQAKPITPAVRVQEVKRTSDAVITTLCIEMPSLEPWNPYATLTIDGTVIPNAEVRLLNAKDPQVMQTPNRCYAFTFPLEDKQATAGQGVLKLENLWLELGNGFWNEAVVAQMKERARKVAPGLDFEVVHVLSLIHI